MSEKLVQYLKLYAVLSLIAILSGLSSALFLFLLEKTTQIRVENSFLYLLLPIFGLIVGLLYHFFGRELEKGNDLILERLQDNGDKIPLKMSFLVLMGTLFSHLGGASVGREGTAIQMSGAIAYQFNNWLGNDKGFRKTALLCGISAGFASIFGTPLAGGIFAIEILWFRNNRFQHVLAVFYAAFLADFICTLTGIKHTHYNTLEVDYSNTNFLIWTIITGILCGFSAFLFIVLKKNTAQMFTFISIPYLRPFIAGIVIAIFFIYTEQFQYAGLGLPTIESAFSSSLPWYNTFLKNILTAFSLGSGFKGGEVTPLFFMGATLGNTLAQFSGVPLYLLAAVGFVAFFAGATNTPLASTIMGIELFGIDYSLYLLIACYAATLFSGYYTIYTAQTKNSWKYKLYNKLPFQRWKHKI
jgi:H+/Cl- antiporter ClcA